MIPTRRRLCACYKCGAPVTASHRGVADAKHDSASTERYKTVSGREAAGGQRRQQLGSDCQLPEDVDRQDGEGVSDLRKERKCRTVPRADRKLYRPRRADADS